MLYRDGRLSITVDPQEMERLRSSLSAMGVPVHAMPDYDVVRVAVELWPNHPRHQPKPTPKPKKKKPRRRYRSKPVAPKETAEVERKPTKRRCPLCGRMLTVEEWAYWGECPSCNQELPIRTCGGGDVGASTDRAYHGGRFYSGEW